MQTLRKMTAATVLACILAVSAIAGDMHTPSVTAPPPPPDPTASSTAAEETGESEDGLTDLIASLLSSLLAVL